MVGLPEVLGAEPGGFAFSLQSGGGSGIQSLRPEKYSCKRSFSVFANPMNQMPHLAHCLAPLECVPAPLLRVRVRVVVP